MSRIERPSVLIVSEIRLYREGLAQALESDSRLVVVDTCDDAGRVLDVLHDNSADAILLDVGISSSRRIAACLVRSASATKVIALGLNETEHEVLPFVESGVAGYVCRDGTVNDVVQAVLAALRQEMICSRQIAAALQRRVRTLVSRSAAGAPSHPLTRRESEIAHFLHDGLSNKAIAAKLNITISTVKNHVHSVLEKLNARSRTEAAAKMRQLGIAPGVKSNDPDSSGTKMYGRRSTDLDLSI